MVDKYQVQIMLSLIGRRDAALKKMNILLFYKEVATLQLQIIKLIQVLYLFNI